MTSMELIGKAIVALLALAGFFLATYIRSTKNKVTPLVCPLEGSCEEVIFSKYSTILGVPIENVGMAYYFLTATAYILSILFPPMMPSWIPYLILIASACAFIFSMYLTAVQAVLLKHWCTWCLMSAGLCTLIFILALLVLNRNILSLFGV